MNLIQFILVPFAGFLVFFFLKKTRSPLMGRVLVLAFGVLGALMVIFPNIAQSCAKFVGVGRGVDLVFYLGFCGVGLICILLFAKCRGLEEKLTELTRKVAIDRAYEQKKEGESGE